MANKNISIAEALQKVSKTAHEYINKNTPHVISEDVILTIPASSIVKADYETAKANDEPYYVAITDTVAEEFNENNIYSVKFNEKEYDCSYEFGSYNVSTDSMLIGITLTNDAGATEAPTPPYCYIGLIDTTNITDIQLISKKVQRLDNMYLEHDLEVVNSLTIGDRTGNIGKYSLASGNGVEASGVNSHAEGSDTIASGECSHAEGDSTKATNYGSHAEGCVSESSGMYSHAEGHFTKASSDYQHVQGKYNIEDAEGKYAHIVGNGANDKTTNWKEVRSNAHTLDWAGNAWFAGDVQANNVPYVVSESVVLTVPAATITAKADDIDALEPLTQLNIELDDTLTIDDTKLYVLKYNNTEYEMVKYVEPGVEINPSYPIYTAVGEDLDCLIGFSNGTTSSGGDSGGSGGATPMSNDDSGVAVYDGDDTTTKTILKIAKLNTSNITDLQIIKREINKLENKYLNNDLVVGNSLTVGCRPTNDIGVYSISEGYMTSALHDGAHASGYNTTAYGQFSHAEGLSQYDYNSILLMLGNYVSPSGQSLSIDSNESKTDDKNDKSDEIFGRFDDIVALYDANPNTTIGSIDRSTIMNIWGHSDHGFSMAYGLGSHVEGFGNLATDMCTHVEGSCNLASNNGAHAEGTQTIASGVCAHTEGNATNASGDGSHAEGNNTTASGLYSHAEGRNTESSNSYTHAEGGWTTASGFASHAEGNNTTASGSNSHAEGYYTVASGDSSHAEGYYTKALEKYAAHAEGYYTLASGQASHAEGEYTVAAGSNQHVQGKYNIKDTENKYAHIVGNGTSDTARANAHTLDWSGNAWYAGKVSQEAEPTEDNDLTTKKYVDEHSANVADGFVMNDQVNGYKYLIQMRDGVLTSILLPSFISVDTSSLEGVTFMDGDAIDVETLTFMANYPDGTSSQITDTENLSYTPAELTTDVTQISFVYSIAGLELTYDMPITVTAFDPAVKLQDFEYTTNSDGTYTLTGWKETYNGVASTELIIPNNKKIIL